MANLNAAASPVAQITICGALDEEHVAALVKVAIAAGAALMVQPRQPADVVQAPPALPPAPVTQTRSGKSSARRDVGLSDVAVREFLGKRGPVSPGAFRKQFKLSAFGVRGVLKDLGARGVVQLTGKTAGRRVGLPGQAAKEAP